MRSNQSGNGLIVLLIGLVVIFAVIFGPYALIWSLNTLFGLKIIFSFDSWLAALVLMSIFAPSNRVKLEKS